MRLAGKSLTAGLFALYLTNSALAQVPYYMGPGAAPVFQANPLLQQAAANQNLVNQAILNQTLTQQAVAARVGAIPGLPNYLGSASITSTPSTPLPSGTYGGSGFNSFGPYGPGYFPGSGFWTPYGFQNPIGAQYNGIANMTLAYGQYIQDYQKGRLMNEEIVRSKILTRRQLIEEWRYEQSLVPKAEDIRRVELERDLARASKQAPIGEILSGKSLNVLLTHLKQFHGNQKRGPVIPTSEETLAQINVSTKHGRNIGAIKTGKVIWPIALRDENFTKFREKFDTNLEDAVNRAKINGRVDLPLLKDLDLSRRGLDETLDKIATDMSMAQYMEAKRTLGVLAEGVRALEDPDVANYFNRKYEVRGKTISDVVDYMDREGLIFVASVPGSEGAYRTMYAWMLSYYEAVNQLASR